MILNEPKIVHCVEGFATGFAGTEPCDCMYGVCYDLWRECLTSLDKKDLALTYKEYAEKYKNTGKNKEFLAYIANEWAKKRA